MADFKTIKDNVLDKLGVVAGKTKDVADKAVDKAKDVSRIAKLNLEINSEKSTMEKAYTEIGKLYYETRKDDPDGVFIQFCDDITVAKENIATLHEEIDELKANGANCNDGSIEVEFEEVTNESAEKKEDCNCGCSDNT